MWLSRRVWITAAAVAGSGLALLMFTGRDHARHTRLPVVDGRVDLAALGPDWDRLCVLRPYATNASARMTLGFDIDIESRSDITMSDSIALLVVMRDGKPPVLLDVQRDPSDFALLGDSCWPNGTEFVVRPETGREVHAR